MTLKVTNVEIDITLEIKRIVVGFELTPEWVARYGAVLTGTHPEYYSLKMLDAMQDYTDLGGRLMYLGANGFYWRIAWHPSLDGVIEHRRSEDGMRAWMTQPGESYMAFTGEYSGLWQRNGRPPNVLVGTAFTVELPLPIA